MSHRDLFRKIYWTAAFLAVFILAVLISVIFLNPTSVGSPDFIRNINLWAVIWAFTFVIVVILSFILARDLIKLFFEYQAEKPGSGIKSKLVTTFVIFSLFPALIMSFLAFGLINRNLQLWFTSPSEQLFGSSDQMVSQFYEQNRRYAILAAREVAAEIPPEDDLGGLQLRERLEAAGFSAVVVEDGLGRRLFTEGEWLGSDEGLQEALSRALTGDSYYERRRLYELEQPEADLIVVAVPVPGTSGTVARALLAQLIIPQSVQFHAIQVEEARQKYEELKANLAQVEVNYFSVLLLTTLAVIFGFVWLGAYIARKITVPLEALADGAEALADGNLDHRVDVRAVDELGILVKSFNRMAEEIKQSRLELEKANEELVATNVELNERRRYTETILQNIATGVISIDESDVIRTVNEAALTMLQTTRERILNHSLREVAEEDLQAEIEKIKERARLYGTYRKDITFTRGEKRLYIAATVTANPLRARDESEYLFVLDDLTELIKAEKFAAWQEVARRLAHEIKNPLTPIQLSAERIKKRFEKMPRGSAELKEFGRVLDQSVRIISAEAEMLKTLVNEFSRFARLPISQPVETELHSLIEQTLSLFDGRLKSVRVERAFDAQVDKVRLDPEQMRRVFVNLIDNSLDALSDCSGTRRIWISTRMNRSRRSVTIQFSDNGVGIEPQDYDDLFLPYFSTKKKGTGLGLAIVRQIVSEHHGFVRAEPNDPQGMRFIIDIPLE